MRRGPSIGPQLGYVPPEAQKPTPACGCLSLPVWSRGVSPQVGEFTLPPREGWLLTLGAPAPAPWSRRVEGGCGIPGVSSPVHSHNETSVPPEPCGVLGHLCPGLLAQSCHPFCEDRQVTIWSAVTASRPLALGQLQAVHLSRSVANLEPWKPPGTVCFSQRGALAASTVPCQEPSLCTEQQMF